MLYAARGVGKTHVAIGIAVAVAGGGEFLRWKADKPRGVLYIDGEMPGNALQARYAQAVASIELASEAAILKIITPDLQECSIPDLSTLEGQDAIEPHLDGVSLVILDNLSCLCRSGRENETESWIGVQEWFLYLRRRGIAILFVHHAGKGGQQRGASKREDILDAVISLTHPGDYKSSEGARFVVEYEKNRHFYGDEAKPFEALLTVSPDMTAIWAIKDLELSLTERVAALLNEGIPQHEIADMLGVNKGTVSKHKKKAIEMGLINGGDKR